MNITLHKNWSVTKDNVRIGKWSDASRQSGKVWRATLDGGRQTKWFKKRYQLIENIAELTNDTPSPD